MAQKMKRRNVLIILILLAFGFSHISYAEIYYIAPNGSNSTGDGSEANPWASPLKAKKSTGAIAPGDTVIFKNGNYSYTGSTCLLGYNNDDGGTVAEPITYKAETRGSVTIDFNEDWGWRLQDIGGNANNIVLDGFNIVNTKAGVVIYATGAVVRYINVTGTATWPPTGDPFSKATGQGGFVTQEGAEFLIEHCIADETAAANDHHGIYVAGGSGTIRDSIFRNILGNGIQIQAKNDEHDIGTVYVYRNKVYNNTERHGIYISAYKAGSAGPGTVEKVYVYNNVVYNNGMDYASGIGITCSDKDGGYANAEIYNNTVYYNHYGLSNTCRGGLVLNNIVIDSTGSYDIGSSTKSNADITFSAANNLETGSLASSAFVSTDSEDSDFLKLKPTAAAAIDQGTDTGIADDYFNNQRGGSNAIDIGAHEYTQDAVTNLKFKQTP